MHFAEALFDHLVDELPMSERHDSWRFHHLGELAVSSGMASIYDPTSGEADDLDVPPGSHRVYVVMDAVPEAAPMALGILLWFGEAPPVVLGEFSGVGVLTHCGVVCLSSSQDNDDALVSGLMRLAGQEIRRRATHGQDRGLLPVFEDACRQYRPDALQPPEESAPGAFRAGWHILSDEGTKTTVIALLDNGEGGSIYPCLDAQGREVAHLVQFETE
ncbi:hypothetical protein OG747_50695 (plasmid) [Streptomyces sp. NBC_01384]|uniref:hypothetical protein n=1 Tax=Streptomyces sp. NBC_01384 TaxID=2903847 RepID=UPI002F9110C5